MNYVIIIEAVNLGLTSFIIASILVLYLSRKSILSRLEYWANSYINRQIESVRANPEALAKLLNPVIQKLLADMTKSMKGDVPSPGSLGEMGGNLIQDVGLSFLPKKYQAPASLLLRLFGNRINPSSNNDNKDSKSPFQ
jgi:hypothetical protein